MSRLHRYMCSLCRWAIAACVSCTLTGCFWLEYVSIDESGNQFPYGSGLHAISGDGRYVVISGGSQLYHRDLRDQTTVIVSVSSVGERGSWWSNAASISSDGRYVAFESEARNLVPDDTNSASDIFVHDTLLRTTTRVSVSSSGEQAQDYRDSIKPAISGNGRYVAFASSAGNLVPGDNNGHRDVFVHDRVTATTTRISVDPAGNETTFGHLGDLAISHDGSFVAFVSAVDVLVEGDTNGNEDVFLRDMASGVTTRVNLSSAGEQSLNGDGWHLRPAISGDGRYIAFTEEADNLVPGDDNGEIDAFVHDRVTGETTRVNVSSNGEQANDGVTPPVALSHDGRFVAFSSGATNLDPENLNNTSDVFLHDRKTGTTRRLSVDAVGREVNGYSGFPKVSADGRYVGFSSGASNFLDVPDSNTWRSDAIVRALRMPRITAVVPDKLPIGPTTEITIMGKDFHPETKPFLPAVMHDVEVRDEETITLSVTVPDSAEAGAYDVRVYLMGTGPGPQAGSADTCRRCITFF